MATVDCVFCRIVEGREPAVKVAEDEVSVSVMDRFPLVEGHVLVIPRTHYEDVRSTPEDVVARLFVNAARVARALYETGRLRCEATGINHGSGAAAGQSVFHFHVHVRPRYPGDGIPIPPRGSWVSDGELDETARRIREALARPYV